MSFSDMSRDVLKDYISTVLYIDDDVFSSGTLNLEPQVLRVPERLKVIEGVKEEESTQNVIVSPSRGKIKNDDRSEFLQILPKAHEEITKEKVDIRSMTEAFARQGIQCAFLQPGDDNIDSIQKTLRKADVVILDWQINKDNGKTAKQLIRGMLQSLEKGLHLLVIWTQEYDLQEIAQIIYDDLQTDNKSLEKNELIIGQSRIVVYHQEVEGEHEANRISVEQLPLIIINQLVEMTKGILPNTLLKSITLLKENSADLLALYNKKLDQAYLAHRAMCPSPNDGDGLLLNMIRDSLLSLISAYNVNHFCGQDAVAEWLKENVNDDFTVSLKDAKDKPFNLSKSDLINWQLKGLKQLLDSKEIKGYNELEMRKLKNWGQRCFCADDSLQKEFASLSINKNTHQVLLPPILTLGSVVKTPDGDILVCIQQRCDSVRLEVGEKRNFLFLPVHDTAIRNLSKPIMVELEKKYIYFRSFDLQIITFVSTLADTIRAEKDDTTGGYYFSNNDKKYEWLFDLKDSIAQRLSDLYTSQLSRIGLDESEWLRRN